MQRPHGVPLFHFHPLGTQSSLLMLTSLSPPSSLSTGIFSHFFQLLPIPLWHPADYKSALFQEPHSNGTCGDLGRALVPSSYPLHLTSIGYAQVCCYLPLKSFFPANIITRDLTPRVAVSQHCSRYSFATLLSDSLQTISIPL